MELLHNSGEIIAERYRILDTLGQGGVGITYRAEDLKTGQQVALKALSLRRIADWKTLELFEREAQILSQLHHPAIPRYLDYFQTDTSRERGFYIAQQLEEGKSLAALVENGWRPDEREVRHIATQILDILIYLHSLTPPVIHRDIKPQNLIRSSDGRVFLVDFGSVTGTYHNTLTGGSTVVGTYGYMAPEQFRGQAVLSTDLYGLGATLLFLLTGKSPADLPQRSLKINFRPHVRISKEFASWLEKTLEPVIEDRFPSAEEALAVLRGEKALANYSTQKPRRPKDTAIRLTRTENRLMVEIPPVWFSPNESRRQGIISFLMTLLFSLLLWLVILLMEIQDIMNTSGFLSGFFGVIILILKISIIAGLLDEFITLAVARTQLEIDRYNFRGQVIVLGWRKFKVQFITEDINWVQVGFLFNSVKKKTLNSSRFIFVGLKSNKRYWLWKKSQYFIFGKFMTQRETEWLVGEIGDFLTNRQDAKSAKED
ncbi:MAG: serine/threonine protein kinase [Oscillatoria princeps RMCB-10]|jgi:serine/threonine protein kinase|nr:serine/threonine protein kinase [Oscillatoria princeps RMCB-10]